jgi:hypothetical protein
VKPFLANIFKAILFFLKSFFLYELVFYRKLSVGKTLAKLARVLSQSTASLKTSLQGATSLDYNAKND